MIKAKPAAAFKALSLLPLLFSAVLFSTKANAAETMAAETPATAVPLFGLIVKSLFREMVEEATARWPLQRLSTKN